MKRIEIGDEFRPLAELIRRSAAPGTTILLTERGEAFASLTLLNAEDFAGADDETIAVALNPLFQATIARSRRQWEEGLAIPADEVHRQLELDGRPPRRRRGGRSMMGAYIEVRSMQLHPALAVSVGHAGAKEQRYLRPDVRLRPAAHLKALLSEHAS